MSGIIAIQPLSTLPKVAPAKLAASPENNQSDDHAAPFQISYDAPRPPVENVVANFTFSDGTKKTITKDELSICQAGNAYQNLLCRYTPVSNIIGERWDKLT